jgi:hypothetical protein
MILQENFVEKHKEPNQVFSKSDFNDLDFKRKLSLYFLGEVKDQMSFYYSSSDYEVFLKFFEYLNGTWHFNYNEYLSAYSSFAEFLIKNGIQKPAFCETADGFLQFLYGLNVIGYVEDTLDNQVLVRLCFRERNYSNISPKVRTHLRYEIHYGLRRALNLGKPIVHR